MDPTKTTSKSSHISDLNNQEDPIVNKEGTGRLGTWEVTWRDVGIVKYLLSRVFKTHLNDVRREFKSVLTKKLKDRAAEIRSSGTQEEQKEQWNVLVHDVRSISKADMRLKDKIELLMGIEEFGERYKQNIIKDVKNAIFGNLDLDKDFNLLNQDLIKEEKIYLGNSIKTRKEGEALKMDFAESVITMAIKSKAKTSREILVAINLSPHFTSEQKKQLSQASQNIAIREGRAEGEFKQIQKGGQDYAWIKLTPEEASHQMRYAAAASCAVNGGDSEEGGGLNNYSFMHDSLGVRSDEIRDEDKFTYKHRLEELQENGSLANINDELKEKRIKSNIQVNSDPDNYLGYYDFETGLRFVILNDDASGSLIISFGPALSVVDTDDDINDIFQKQQLKVAATQWLGTEIPAAYIQAAKIVQKVKDNYGKNVILTGYCFGGSLAQYAGLKIGVEAHCFNGLPLGAALQNDIGEENLKKANELVTQVSVRHEAVSDMHGIGYIDRFLMMLGFKTPANFGKRYVIPPARESYSSFGRHIKIYNSMLVHAGWRMQKQ